VRRALAKLAAMALGGLCVVAGIADQTEPSAEKKAEAAKFFLEAARVMQSPRCLNCHTGGDFPRQGDDRHPHTLDVKRGPNDRGLPGLTCNVCHQDRNMAGIPGSADWHLAPVAMGWDKLSAGEICRAVTDTKRNGNRLPKGVVLHVENDSLVRWAWNPGDGRTPPPVAHEQFVQLLRGWSDAGGACPD
jgi:hypothetical protein